jgi:4-amino-4-deoxy-L-arabinose transferase-like glycosyltransferase
MEPARRQYTSLLLVILCLLLAGVAYGLRLWLLRVRAFDPDEFEHLHAAWVLTQGDLPYRDYFEHHAPGLYFLLQPLLRWLDPAAGITQALAAIRAARHLMWLLTGVILLLTFQLGRLWRQWRVGLLGTVLLGSIITFLQKTLEVRPDVPALACWTGCLAAFLYGMRRDAAGGRSRWWWGGSGILLGLALMMTQKVLFAGPGFALAMAWYLLDRRSPASFRARAGNIACQLAGVALPVALTLGYFACRDGLHEFIEFNLLLNLRWKSHFPPDDCLRRLLVPNPVIPALGLIGLARALGGMFTAAGSRRGDAVLALNTLGLIIGLYILPVPRQQYLLLFLPLLALLAADTLAGIIGLMVMLRDRRAFEHHFAWVLAGVGGVIFVTGFLTGRACGVPHDSPHVHMRVALAVLALSLAWIPVRYRCRDLALAVVVLLLCLEPLQQMRALFRDRNDTQLTVLRYVMENTAPDAPVMDGWEGVGVFRPHAWFYWMVHGEIPPLLTLEQKRQLLEDLHRGRIAPALVNLDGCLRDISPEITTFFEEAYTPVGIGSIRLRKRLPPATLPEPGPFLQWSERPAG